MGKIGSPLIEKHESTGPLFRGAPGCEEYKTFLCPRIRHVAFLFPCILHAACCKALYMLSAAMLSDWLSGPHNHPLTTHFLSTLISGAHLGGHGKP